jgi:hypothetical protein
MSGHSKDAFNAGSGIGPGIVGRIDPASCRTVRRCGWTVWFILIWGIVRRNQLPPYGLVSMMIVAAMTTAAIAVWLREPFPGPSLNRWDETAAYLGLGCCRVCGMSLEPAWARVYAAYMKEHQRHLSNLYARSAIFAPQHVASACQGDGVTERD